MNRCNICFGEITTGHICNKEDIPYTAKQSELCTLLNESLVGLMDSAIGNDLTAAKKHITMMGLRVELYINEEF